MNSLDPLVVKAVVMVVVGLFVAIVGAIKANQPKEQAPLKAERLQKYVGTQSRWGENNFE